MKTKQVLFNVVLLAAFLVSACSGAAAPTAETMMEKEVPTAEAMMDKATPTADATMSKETPAADAMDTMMEVPAWYSASLTDASTGQAFTINDFKGKVVLVETLAMWCSNCKQQQTQVKALHDLLGERDDFVSIGLDIDLNENAADLKGYVEGNGFDWMYAVATVEIAQDISKHYGDQFLNPPSTPMLVIDRKGEAHPLPFGIKSADELLKFIQPFLDEAI
jgi:thiol-disulfide isomerase/thioredoxin